MAAVGAKRDLSLPLKTYVGGGLTTRAVTTVFASRVFSAFGSNTEVIILAGPVLRIATALTERPALRQSHAEGDFTNYQTLGTPCFGGARVLALCWCAATPGNVLAEGMLAVSSSDSVIRFFSPDLASPRRQNRLAGGGSGSTDSPAVPEWTESFALRTDSPCFAIDFMFDGAFFAAGGAHFSVWKAQASSSAVEGFEGLRYVSEVTMAMEAEPLALLSFTPDGRFIATTGLHGFTVSVWFEGTSIYGSMNCLDLPHPAPPVYLSWWNNEVLREPTDVLNPQENASSAATRLIPNVLLTFAQDGQVRLWQETDTSESLRFFVTAVIDGSETSPPSSGLSSTSSMRPVATGSGATASPLLSAAWLDVHHPLTASESAALPATFGGKRGALSTADIMRIYSRTTANFPRHCHGTNALFLDQADSRLGIKHDVIGGEGGGSAYSGGGGGGSGASGGLHSRIGPSAIIVCTPSNQVRVWVLTGLGAVPRTSLRVTLWGRANMQELKKSANDAHSARAAAWRAGAAAAAAAGSSADGGAGNSKILQRQALLQHGEVHRNSARGGGRGLEGSNGFHLDTFPIAAVSRLSTLPSSLFAFQLAAATPQQPLGAVEQVCP